MVAPSITAIAAASATTSGQVGWRHRLARWGALFGAALLVAACGGGDATPGAADGPAGAGGGREQVQRVGSGGTGAFRLARAVVVTPDTVTVGGVKFNLGGAAITDGDGQPGSASALKPGMTMEVESDVPVDGTDGLVANAALLRYSGDLLGPATGLDVAAGKLNVIGQPVRVGPGTRYGDDLPNGLADVSAGDALEVHAYFDVSAGVYRATHIERRAVRPAAWRVRGLVSALDPAARTFRIGRVPFDYGSLGDDQLPALADGQFVKATVDRRKVDGVWMVTKLEDGAPEAESRIEAGVEGRITAYTSPQAFVLNGLQVDGSRARIIGDPDLLGPGVIVEAEGRLVGKVLKAQRIEIEIEDAYFQIVDLEGSVQSVDAAAQTFRIGGRRVEYGHLGVRFVRGTAAALQPGAAVRLRAVRIPDTNRLSAMRIEFRD